MALTIVRFVYSERVAGSVVATSLTIVRFVYSERVAVLLTSYVSVSKQVLPAGPG